MRHDEISLNTKKALADALKEAMKKKAFQKITVCELIKACNVNRKTFYYHFTDIYSLLKWTLEEEAIEVVKNFNLLVDYEEAITFIMDYIEKNDYIINCAYDSIGRDELKRFLYSDFLDIIISIIDGAEQEVGKSISADYKKFLSVFYMEAVAGILIDWIKDREHRNRATVIKYISTTMRESLTAILQNYNQI